MNEIYEKIEKTALELLERAELPEDTKEADKLKRVFIDHVKRLNWTKKGEDIVIMGEDQLPLQDPHGWDLTHKDIVKMEYAKFFTDTDLPQTRQEFEAELKNKNITPERRIEITKYWRKKHPGDF